MGRTAIVVVAILVLAGAARAAPAALPGSPRSDEALDLCLAADRGPIDEREALLSRSLALAEAAVLADDTDAKAHFAVFCALGRRLQLHPFGLGSLSGIRRLRREIDRTLALAPNSPDALTAKGIFLTEAPGFLGGDLNEAERLLRRAIAVDHAFARAHLGLAQVLAQRDAHAEAHAEARTALAHGACSPGSLDEARAEALPLALAQNRPPIIGTERPPGVAPGGDCSSAP